MRQPWQMWSAHIKPKDCDALVEKLRALPPMDGKIVGANGELVDDPMRYSKIRWVDDQDIRDVLWQYAKEANRLAFGLDVMNVGSIQFTEYDAEYKGKYDWHMDCDLLGNCGVFARKISLVLQLSDGDSYEGGDFQFHSVQNPKPEDLRAKGTVICFPSHVHHRVTKVTKGVRYSLVTWFEGPLWR